jgi:hypothetical protein
MSILKALIIAAPLALSTAAMAAPDLLTDSQYIAASRCQALMASSYLGREDTKDIDAAMRVQGARRLPAVADRAEDARAQADSAARHAGPYSKAALIAERDGPCQTLLAHGATSAAVDAHKTTRTN